MTLLWIYHVCALRNDNVDTERGGRVTLSFISSHKYVIPEIKSFTCIGKYLIYSKVGLSRKQIFINLESSQRLQFLNTYLVSSNVP
jgi:hypothetical protein